MITGHFALAAGVKAFEPKVPLWALMTASQVLEIAFIPLFLTGIETLVPLGAGGYGGSIIHADYTHSLVGALLLSLVVWAFGRWRWGARGGLVLGAMTFSHWLLDLLVHRADLPLLPGNLGGLPTLGLGLWQFPAVTASLELGMALVATVLYGRSLLAHGTRGKAVSWVVTALMGLCLLGSLALDWFGL